ncbi:MAG TPA: tetratricopeptide repeat protein [Ktedonobacteraceae bacterium]|nr:tetratricopeptide repeat protein [Ktedonobacteraceae bacterium]
MSDQQTSFGTLLKRYRMAAGLTQEALAASANLSARTIADLERGINRLPRHDTLELLMAALNVTSQQRSLLLAIARPEMTAAARTASLLRLPLPPTALIGREQELTQALTRLRSDGVRLLTLTGPAGIGKTRLGLQVARDLEPHFAQGAVFVSLAPLREAQFLPFAIAQAFGLYIPAEEDISEYVSTCLHEQHCLLVLDNFEQVIEAAPLVANLLSICPHLSVLVTSRLPLRLRGEHILPLAPLPIEDAVLLFQERAAAIRPGRDYVSQEVAAICERLDYLPLAIELAAMHVKTFTLPDLYARLVHRLVLLRDGARDLPVRQQTMEDALAWSYELLSEAQQRCFRQLAVFMGGWTLEAAEAVFFAEEEQAHEEIVLTLAALVDASLVQVAIPVEGQARFDMLELMREYGLERLRAAGEEEECRRRHALYYARLSETASSEAPGQRGQEAALLQDVQNIRIAMQWAEERQETALGLRLATACKGSWFTQGYMSEAEVRFERLLRMSWQEGAQEVPPGLRAVALYAFGQILLGRGKTERAEAVARDGLERGRRSEDHGSMSSALAILGHIAQRNRKLDEATTFLLESDEQARRAGIPDLRGFTLRNLAELARMQGDLERATTLYEEALTIARATGMSFGVALIMTMLGHLARQRKDYSLAKARYQEGLRLLRAFSSPTYTAWCLEGFAAAICAQGDYAHAVRLCAAAAALREQVQTPLPPTEREAFEQTVATAKVQLDEATFVHEWEAGTVLSQDQAINDALNGL